MRAVARAKATVADDRCSSDSVVERERRLAAYALGLPPGQMGPSRAERARGLCFVCRACSEARWSDCAELGEDVAEGG